MESRRRIVSVAEFQIEPLFRVRREDEADAVVLVVEGDVDLATAPELKQELESIWAESNVVVDLCETRFMDSTGLRVLLATHSALSRGIRVACKPAGPISRLFDVSFAGQHLRIYKSRADALANL
jgi:anti-sigma B factor antagonist